MRPDGHKVDAVVVGLNIDRELTVPAALRQYRNARLIAASPDLLEACEPLDAKLTHALKSFGAAEHALGGPITDDDAVMVSIGQLRAIRAAIAKATGK